jgi:NADPH:quinone reductase-like Zn-dependent oxidoreductase
MFCGGPRSEDREGVRGRGGGFGGVDGEGEVEAFEPVSMIPSGAKLTTFHSEDLTGAAGRAPLAHIIGGVEHGTYHANLDRVFTLDQIADAHRYMEGNQATGKVVIQP